MTQEEKTLKLKDLCSRLPHGVKGKVETTDGNGKEIEDGGVLNSVFIDEYGAAYICIEGAEYELEDVKPYLRPMSSMTEKENTEMNLIIYSARVTGEYFRITEYYNKNHLDYRGLIPMELALEAPEEMYNFKND